MAFSSLATSLTINFCNEITGGLESCKTRLGALDFTAILAQAASLGFGLSSLFACETNEDRLQPSLVALALLYNKTDVHVIVLICCMPSPCLKKNLRSKNKI